MPTKKKTKYTSAKSSASSSASSKTGTVFTGDAIVINLDAAAQRKATQCLEKSGKITFSVKERSATKLHQVLDNGEKID
jgi:hypothetical protein